MSILLWEEQKTQLSSRLRIQKAIAENEVLAFDIWDDGKLVGFAMLRPYKDGYFLWNYAIDCRYQNQYLGTRALIELLEYMKCNYRAAFLTTTYRQGNTHARHIYEKAGFCQTDIVDENGIHEVNMVVEL